MPRSHARRVALTSSFALLLGAGAPLEHVLAASVSWKPWRATPSTVDAEEGAWGFDLVPGPTPKGLLPEPTPETPGAGGFEVLPATTGAEASQATATAPGASLGSSQAAAVGSTNAVAPQPVGINGFVLLPETVKALSAPPAPPAEEAIPTVELATSGVTLRPAPAATSLSRQSPAGGAPLSTKTPALSVENTTQNAPAGSLELIDEAPQVATTLAALQLTPATPTVELASIRTEPRRVELNARPPALVLAPAEVAEPAPAVELAQAPMTVRPASAPVSLDQVGPRVAGLSLAARTPEAWLERTVETPGVGGFEMLPATAGAGAAQAAAVVETPTAPLRPAPVTSPDVILLAQAASADQSAAGSAQTEDANGFELTSDSPSGGGQSASSGAVNGFETVDSSSSAPATEATASTQGANGFELQGGAPEPTALASAPTPADPQAQFAAVPASEPQPVLAEAPPPPSPEPQQFAQTQPPPFEPAPQLSPDRTPPEPPPEPIVTLPLPEPEPAAQPAAVQTNPAPPPEPATAPPPPPPPPPVTAPPPPVAEALPPVERPLAIVGRILVQGNERIEPATVLSYLPIQPGDGVDAARLDLAVKTLFRTDLFADVSMELQGTDLIVKVSENPIVNQVVFEGNKALKEDKLRDEVTIRPRGIFTRSKVEQDVQRIIELYRRSGRISASVTPKIIQLPQKRVDLIFEIDEGPKSGVLHINFIGNKSYSDNALGDVIVTRDTHWYKFFGSNDNYDPDRLEYDREQLRKYYRNHGFYDFRIISAVAELAPDKNGFVITFTLDEGPKYHFGKLKVETQLKRLNGELLQALLPIREGQLYQDERIERATDSLTYAAGANGFAFVDIRPRYTAHADTKTVDVTFDIREGPRVYIERIDVVGNTQTLDKVIRREMRVAEGDAYNRVLVDRSKNQIRGLGFFKDVDIEQLPGSAPDKTVLRVKVTEQPTGQLTFSLGYSSVEKLVGDVGISQSNFRGRGQNVNFQVSLGYLRKQVVLSFTEPRFLGRNLGAGFDLYTYRYNYSNTASFESASTGLNLRAQFPINQYSSVGTKYSVHADKVTIPGFIIDPATGRCIAGYSQSLCDELGTSFTSSVGWSVRWDRRNDPILPTRGFYMDFIQDFAGVGGDVQYIRTILDGAWYYGFTPAWVVSVQGQAGYINGWGGDVVRINDRFFKGGENFRGFEIAGIGPRDVSLLSTSGSPIGDSLGGKMYGIGTVELTVPTPLPPQYGIKTSLFTDFGTLGLLDEKVRRNPDGTIDPQIKDDLAFRASAGITIKWKSPMGPLQFDLSKVLAKAPYDRTETFRFSTATRF